MPKQLQRSNLGTITANFRRRFFYAESHFTELCNTLCPRLTLQRLALLAVGHGITLQVHRPAHLHGWSIHFTSARNKKPRFLRASTIPSNDPAMIVITTPQI
ncbi:hypothetical protein [Pseudomonas hormoni]